MAHVVFKFGAPPADHSADPLIACERPMQRESPISGCFQAILNIESEGGPGTIETTLCDIKLTLAPSEILYPTTLGDETS